MIQQVEMFGAKCDNCNEEFEDSITGFSAMPGTDNLCESLKNNGWLDVKGYWYCPDCWTTNEKDELIINKNSSPL